MSQSITDLISIRPIEQADLHFILDSAIQCLSKYTESIFKGMTHDNIQKHLELLVLYVLNNPQYFSVFVAVHKDDSSQILAYVIADTSQNHVLFQYTKYSYRKLGVQKFLLMPLVTDPALPITVNWPTKEMLKLTKLGKVEIIPKLIDRFLHAK